MSVKCKACNTSVYPNDSQISLDGTVYHKPCAKCADCKCQITLSNFTKSGDTLLCKTHYFKRFHEEGSYLGGDKFSRASSQEIGGKKAVEPVNASAASSAGVDDDNRPSGGTASLKSRFERPAAASSGAEPGKVAKKLPSFGSVNPKCAVCSKSIYPNDPQIALDGVKYHKECAKCEDCKCSISLSNFTKSGTTLLCKTHYFTRFSVSGSYLGGDKFEKKAEREMRGPSPSAALFPEESPPETTGTTTTAASEEPPCPPDAVVEPPVAPATVEEEEPMTEPEPVVDPEPAVEPEPEEEVAPESAPVSADNADEPVAPIAESEPAIAETSETADEPEEESV